MTDRLSVRVARSAAEVRSARRMIAAQYARCYGVAFSDGDSDPERKIEPWPHRYLAGRVGAELACVVGLYLHSTYVERFGGVSESEVHDELDAAGAAPRRGPLAMRELTRLVVAPEWCGRGLGRALFAAASCRAFVEIDGGEGCVVLVCAKLSIFRGLHDALGIRSRTLKPFPRYAVHERYRSDDDPMESRLVIPQLDVPTECWEQTLPREIALPSRAAVSAVAPVQSELAGHGAGT